MCYSDVVHSSSMLSHVLVPPHASFQTPQQQYQFMFLSMRLRTSRLCRGSSLCSLAVLVVLLSCALTHNSPCCGLTQSGTQDLLCQWVLKYCSSGATAWVSSGPKIISPADFLAASWRLHSHCVVLSLFAGLCAALCFVWSPHHHLFLINTQLLLWLS